MKLIAIAEEIHDELGSPTDLSQGAITFWLRGNVGKLNNVIGTSYDIDATTYEITPELGVNEKDIIKELYYIYHYDYLIRKNSTASGYGSIVEVTSDGATVRTVVNTEVTRQFVQLKKLHIDTLKSYRNGYLIGAFRPKQTVGDDTEEGE